MSTAYDHRSPAGRRKVSVTRLYEVECSQCGIIDSQRRRSDAEEVARLHRIEHRDHPEHYKPRPPQWRRA